MMPGTILWACAVVAASLAGLLVLHVGFLACTKPIRTPASWRSSTAVLAGLILAGSWLAWANLEPAPASLRVGAVSLFLAGCIVYLELRSLLSRGYSLSILVDVLRQPEGTSLARLQDGYGDGVGLRGLLTRRIMTLSRLRLVRFDGRRVGPLTGPGVVCAALTSGMRKFLRLDLVG